MGAAVTKARERTEERMIMLVVMKRGDIYDYCSGIQGDKKCDYPLISHPDPSPSIPYPQG